MNKLIGYLKNKKILLPIVYLVFSLIIILSLNDKATIILSGNEFSIEVVSRESDMRRGLGGRDEIDTTGMLFIFKKENKHGIWMKDMQFPIDIMWLDKEYKIVDMVENVSPLTYPKIFYPKAGSLYVFEAKQGFVQENKIEAGAKLDISF